MSSDKGGSSKTVTTSPYSAEQRQTIGQGLDIYGPTLGQGANVYQGPRVAPLAGTSQDVLDRLPDFATMFGDLTGSPLQKQLESTAGGLLRGEMGAQPVTPEQESAFFARTVGDPQQRRFERTEAPLIREEFAGPGYWGSARAGEVTEAQRDLNEWLGVQRADLGFDVLTRNQQIEEAKAGRALGAIGPSLAVGEAPTREALGRLGGLGQVAQLSDVERVQRQTEINAEIQKWAEEQLITDPVNLQILMGFLGIPAAGAVTSKTTEAPRSFHSEDWAQNVYGPAIANIITGGASGQKT